MVVKKTYLFRKHIHDYLYLHTLVDKYTTTLCHYDPTILLILACTVNFKQVTEVPLWNFFNFAESCICYYMTGIVHCVLITICYLKLGFTLFVSEFLVSCAAIFWDVTQCSKKCCQGDY